MQIAAEKKLAAITAMPPCLAEQAAFQAADRGVIRASRANEMLISYGCDMGLLEDLTIGKSGLIEGSE